ncbi:MAG: alpha/beta fold hydrolase [Myxococcota bacterium]
MNGGASYAIALLVLILLALHTAQTGLPYILHYYDNVTRGNEQRPSTRGYFRAFTVEWFYGAAVWLAYPFGIFGGAVRDHFDPSGGPPILLCHGYFMNRACFFSLYWRLRRAGYRNVHVLNLRPLISSLGDQAERLERQVRLVSTVAGGRGVIGIGHSQGGILLRWVGLRTNAPLERVLTIGSPHHGTRVAHLALGINAREMLPGSKVLEDLEESGDVPITSFYSDLDQIVNPAESAKLGQDNRFFAETGHFSLLYNPVVLDAVIAALPPAQMREPSKAASQETTS